MATSKAAKPAKEADAGKDANKSEEIRKLLQENPKAAAKDLQAKLAERGIQASGGLIYMIKSKLFAKRRQEKREEVAKAMSTSGYGDPIATIRKVKALASEVGGMGKLKSLLDAMSE